ncbi:MAG: acetyltransferase [Clostridiaceae bacterium]|jgi:ribosomal protein S18 acetylase RimI-like enzyme|nr:acetyltransferase [Clostridiaceae bacterium]
MGDFKFQICLYNNYVILLGGLYLTIKNDIEVHIRIGQLDDAKAILDIKRDVISENAYWIPTTDEFNMTVTQQRDSIQKILENEREIIIIAEVNGIVVGWLEFESQALKKISHTGSFGIMIHKDYRGMGIGRMLVNELLDWAEKNSFIEKVSLGVFSTNHRAISLYKSMGFEEEGRKIKEIRMNENEYIDDILMYKFV